ncbi:SDR family NAD(P)-dependent oxidoreductase, partial [Providencia stuartii]
MKFLITGAAGFIGSAVIKKLLDCGHSVIGIDNLNNYYDVSLKKSRLQFLLNSDKFQFITCDITNTEKVISLFVKEKFDRVIHLAAQAGVRYSLQNPFAYADSNLSGHLAILEGCRQAN